MQQLPPVSKVVIPPPSAVPTTAKVSLSIPADANFLVLVRSAVTHLGSRLGLSLPELDDLRLAANEACSLFLVPGEGCRATDVLDCRFTFTKTTLALRIAADVDPSSPPPFRRFGWALLEALVDTVSWDISGGRATVDLIKRSPSEGERSW